MEGQASLFERIGGTTAVNKAVEIFYSKVLADESLSHFFKNIDMKKQMNMMKNFLSHSFGSPSDFYSGKQMGEAHSHLPLRQEHFIAFTGHLAETLKEMKVAQNLIDEVMAIALSTRGEVLGN